MAMISIGYPISQKLTNGDFSTGGMYWSSLLGATGPTITGGKALFTPAAQYSGISQNGLLPVLANHRYFVKFDASVASGTRNILLRIMGSGDDTSTTFISAVGTVTGTYSTIFPSAYFPVSASVSLQITDSGTAGFVQVTVDNIEVIDMGADASNPLFDYTQQQMVTLIGATYINGTANLSVPLKDPSNLDIECFDIIDEQMSLNGTTNTDIIALDKRTLSISYKLLTSSELSSLLNILKANYYMSVTYTDPVTNASDTITCKVDKRNLSLYTFQTTKKYFQNVKFNLIER